MGQALNTNSASVRAPEQKTPPRKRVCFYID